MVATPATRATVDAAAQAANLGAPETLTINNVQISLNAGSTQTDVINRINSFTAETGVVADNGGAGGATRLYTTEYGLDEEITVFSNLAVAGDTTGFGTTVVTQAGSNVTGTIDGENFVGEGNMATAVTGPATGLVLRIEDDPADVISTVTGALGDVNIEDNSLVFQIGPNQYQTTKIAIGQMLPTSLGLNNSSNAFSSIAEIDVSETGDAQQAIGVIDIAIDEVTALRGELGAFQQNTLDSTANSLRNTLENTVNAESVIRDTDFAVEIANFTKQQVLVQAGTSVLQTATQTSQLVLQLLG